MEYELLQENEVERLKQIIVDLRRQKISLQIENKKLQNYARDLEETLVQQQSTFEPRFHSPHFQSSHQPRKFPPKPPSHVKGHGDKLNTKYKSGKGNSNPHFKNQELPPSIPSKNNRSACSDDHQTSPTLPDTSSPVRKENTCKACLDGERCLFGYKKCWYVHPPKGCRIIKDNSKECCSGEKQTRPCRCNRTDPEKDDYLYEFISSDREEVSHE